MKVDYGMGTDDDMNVTIDITIDELLDKSVKNDVIRKMVKATLPDKMLHVTIGISVTMIKDLVTNILVGTPGLVVVKGTVSSSNIDIKKGQ